MQDILAPGARCDTGGAQGTEGEAEYRSQMIAPQIARRIDGDIDVRAIVAVEHHASDQAPVIILEADATIRLHSRRLQLAHHPFDDGVVCGRVVRQNNPHINPPGM